MRTIRLNNRQSSFGFTLIELMIVVAIIGIITVVAVPSYRDYVMRANRSAAASYLLEVANMQERYFLDNRGYAADMSTLGALVPSEVSDNYTVSFDSVDNTATPPYYKVKAVATGAQTADDCGTLTLDTLGVKGHASGATRCWD